MIILDPIFIHKSENGLYAQRAEENLNELKRLMKDIIIKETKASNNNYVWSNDSIALEKPSESSNYPKTSEQAQTGGSTRQWAKRTMLGPVKKTKKEHKVKTFSL